MFRPKLFVLAAGIAIACAPSDGPVEPAKQPAGEETEPPSTTPPSTASVATLAVYRSSNVADFVGTATRLHFDARDSRGQRVGSAGAIVTSSDPSVAIVTAVRELRVSGSDGRRRNDASADVAFVGPGTAVLRATLNGKEGSFEVRVHALPGPAANIAIERFELIEHRATCTGGCVYLVYTPVVQVRTAPGHPPVSVVALEVAIPGATTGLCTGDFATTPGGSRHLVGVDPYLWNNDIQFVHVDGTPAPEGLATVRVIVREGTDRFGLLSASAQIRRLVSDPLFPPPGPPTEYWTC